MRTDFFALTQSLTRAWSAETSYDPAGWSRDNPAHGQCAVTACVVQDFIGGDIVWTEAQLPDGGRISHFFNRVNGQGIDLTASQFPAGTVMQPAAAYPGAASTRDHILAYPETVARYEKLKAAVQRLMAAM
jgi:hypothetical protein